MKTYRLKCGCLVAKSVEHVIEMCDECREFSARCRAASFAERDKARRELWFQHDLETAEELQA